MLLRLYMKIVVNFVVIAMIGPLCRLYTSGVECVFWARSFSLLHLPLSLVVRRLHITPLLTVARLFYFPSSSCSCWKILSGPESWPNVEPAPHFFCELKLFLYVELNVLIYVERKLFFIRLTQTDIIRQTQTVLVASNSKCCTQLFS